MWKQRKVWWIGIPAVLITGLVVVWLFGRSHPQEAKAEEHAATVTSLVEPVVRMPMPVQEAIPGTVQAIQHAELSPKVMSHIVEVYVSEGDHVRKGQVLARLESRDLDANVQQANAGVLNAEAAYAQARTAYTMQRTQSAVAVQQAEAALAQAKAQLAKAKQGPRPEQVRQTEQAEARAKAGYEQAVAMLNLTKEGARTQQKRQADQAVLAAKQQVTQAEAAVTSAKAQQATIQADYTRMKNLYEQEIIPKQRLDHVTLQLEMARQGVRQAEAGLAQANAGLEMAKEQASMVHEGARTQEVLAAEKQVEQAKAGYEQAQQETAMARQGGRWEDITTAEEAVRQAEAGLRAAKAARARDEVSEKDIQRAKAGIAQAKAGLAGAESMKQYATITAPFSGVITRRQADPGNMAMPQMPIISIDDDSVYQLVSSVPERLTGTLSVGLPISVRLDALNTLVQATITEIVPSADPATRTFTIKANLARVPKLKSGLFGRLLLTVAEETQLTVPASAIVERNGLTGVFTVDDNDQAHYTLVTLGNTLADRVQVLSGLQEGQRVVVDGTDTLQNGTQVRAEGSWK